MNKKTAFAILAALTLSATGAGWVTEAHADLPATGSFGVPGEIPVDSGSAEALTTGSTGTTGNTAGSGSALVPADTLMHARLALAGADRPDAVQLAHDVCGILRDQPNLLGRQAARDHLANNGVPAGFQEGWTLGTAADLYCPDMVSVLR
ncbi:DUF732 domain-containing protein [Nocardia flavorosea]|uniref:DUF732 domain-containing protein n=1 Tax=Nocardia flavorosea TaxID=53429 RepID=A0A846YN07_9NOCA|nr:DUF732 domain-containing protein [Nocardia flavorosea]NKY60435.1 hypothetical protein [Nocardia flavorosea]